MQTKYTGLKGLVYFVIKNIQKNEKYSVRTGELTGELQLILTFTCQSINAANAPFKTTYLSTSKPEMYVVWCVQRLLI